MRLKIFSVIIAAVFMLVGCQGVKDNTQEGRGTGDNTFERTRTTHDYDRNRNNNITQKVTDRNRHSNNRSSNNRDRKSTRLNSSHVAISYAVFCLKKKKKTENN